MKVKTIFKTVQSFFINYNQYIFPNFFAGATMMTDDEKNNLKNQNSKILEVNESCTHKKYEKAISAGVLLGYLLIALSIKKCATGSFLPEIATSKQAPSTKIVHQNKEAFVIQKASGKEKTN